MICSHCGQQNRDGSAFCVYCGTAFQPAQPMPVQPVQPQPPYGYAPVQPRHPVIEAVRSVAASPLYLVAVIAFTVALVFSVLGAGESASAMYDMLGELSMDMDMGEFMPDYASSAYSVGAAVGGIFGSIPNILLVVGLWMIYAAAKKNEPGISSGGFTLVWVMQVIGLVGVCVAAGLVALVLLIALLVSGLSVVDIPDADGTIALVLIAVVAVLFAAIMAFAIVYRVKTMKMVGAVRQTLSTGIPSDKISMLVVVLCFAGGGMAGLSALGSLASLAVMTALSTAASAVASILFGVVALRYRDTMRQLMYPASATYVAPQPDFAPAYTPAQTTPFYDPNPTAEVDVVAEQSTEE